MLGHDTDFGQIECLKLITSQNFADKKIGYLGLTQLFNEKSEVLMMATHRMRTDLQSSVCLIFYWPYMLFRPTTSSLWLCQLSVKSQPPTCAKNLPLKSASSLPAATTTSRRRLLWLLPELSEEFLNWLKNSLKRSPV